MSDPFDIKDIDKQQKKFKEALTQFVQEVLSKEFNEPPQNFRKASERIIKGEIYLLQRFLFPATFKRKEIAEKYLEPSKES